MPSFYAGTACPFCRIVDGDDPDVRVVFRTEGVAAFFPTEPAVLGHTLLVPARHVTYLWDLTPQEAAQLGQASRSLARVMVETLAPQGLSLIQSNGEVASQTVEHVHFHLVPRWNGDAIGTIWPPETSYSESSKDLVWERLARACARDVRA
ncbi:HIT family protein [Demequina sp. NBRC 110055]|uniref:HIT family protein n=1 Tax=Demequina sp. NBRC 110055 TaxID=1570344 RepID=UPI0009FBE65A|nr:HIT domain-containing protein [Demequina sp. NBRC 110055]